MFKKSARQFEAGPPSPGDGSTARRWFWPAIILITICGIVLMAGPVPYLDGAISRLVKLAVMAVLAAFLLHRATDRKLRLALRIMLALVLGMMGCWLVGMTGFDARLARSPSSAAVEWAHRSAHRITRLDTYDPTQWEFLRGAIGDRRIVMLGESNHCVEEYSQAKFDMIRFLHEKLGFNVVAFESYMLPAYRADQQLAAGGRAESAAASIYGIWHTSTVRKLFQYIKDTKSSPAPIHIAGFDMKLRNEEQLDELSFVYGVLESDTALAGRFVRTEASLGPEFYHRLQRGKMNPDDVRAIRFTKFYEALPAELDSAYIRESITGVSATEVRFTAQIARNLAVQPRYRAGTSRGALALRDSLMAMNLQYLADDMYRDQKIIVWAHDSHIARAHSAAILSDIPYWPVQWLSNRMLRIKWMGEYVSDRYQEDVYVLGLHMASGTFKTIYGDERKVRPPRRDSIEYLVRDMTTSASFVDFTHAGDPIRAEWQNSPSAILIESEWYRVIPSQQYDGVLVVSRATPAVTK